MHQSKIIDHEGKRKEIHVQGFQINGSKEFWEVHEKSLFNKPLRHCYRYAHGKWETSFQQFHSAEMFFLPAKQGESKHSSMMQAQKLA